MIIIVIIIITTAENPLIFSLMGKKKIYMYLYTYIYPKNHWKMNFLNPTVINFSWDTQHGYSKLVVHFKNSKINKIKFHFFLFPLKSFLIFN